MEQKLEKALSILKEDLDEYNNDTSSIKKRQLYLTRIKSKLHMISAFVDGTFGIEFDYDLNMVIVRDGKIVVR